MENLLNLNSSNWTWVDNNGEVSATYNSDNTITITSDDTGYWGLNIAQPGLTLSAGKKYIFSCDNIGFNTWISINEDPDAMLKKNHGSIEYAPAEDITSPTIKIWVETTVYDNVTFNISLIEIYTKYNTIRIKRGPSSSLESASLLEGELAVTTDTHDLYVGTSDGYVQLNSSSGPKNIVDGATTGSVRTQGSREESDSYKLGSYAFAEGLYTAASADCSHAQGKYNILDNTLAHIVGNGTSSSSCSNAHTLDWDGNAWFAGDVYVGSTSGTNKDDGSKKLLVEKDQTYLQSAIDWSAVATDITSSSLTTFTPNATLPDGFNTTGTTFPIGTNNYYNLTGAANTWYVKAYEFTKAIELGSISTSFYFNENSEGTSLDSAIYIDFYDSASGSTIPYYSRTGEETRDRTLFGAQPGDKIYVYFVSPTEVPAGVTCSISFNHWFNSATDSDPYKYAISLYNMVDDMRAQDYTVLKNMINNVGNNIPTEYIDVCTIGSRVGYTLNKYVSEVRFMPEENDGEMESLTIGFDDSEFTENNAKFECRVVFKAGSDMAFEATGPINAPTVDFSGDDTAEGIFTPVAYRVYDIAFYWNGWFMSAIVNGWGPWYL